MTLVVALQNSSFISLILYGRKRSCFRLIPTFLIDPHQLMEHRLLPDGQERTRKW